MADPLDYLATTIDPNTGQITNPSHVHIKTRVNGSNANPLNHFNTQIHPNTGQEISPCN